jgi:hypothetical protein
LSRVAIDAREDLVAAATRALRGGANEVVVCAEGAELEGAAVRGLARLGQVRVRVVVHTFDEAEHLRLGGRAHPRDVVRGILRASAAGVHVDVVLPIAEGLGPIAGRLLGLAKAAPRIKRFVYVPVPDELPARSPEEIATEIGVASDLARELGFPFERDGDTRVDTELEAVLAGIKPVMRLSTEGADEAAFIERYRRFGLSACAADGIFINLDGTHSRKLRLLYIAKTPEIAERVRAVEAKTFVPYTDLRARAEEYRELGIALGYPRCCVDAYVARVVLDPDSEMGGAALTEPYVVARGAYHRAPAWELDHLLFETGSALVSFTPCSYRCPSALEYARRVLARVREVSPLAEPALLRRLAVDLVVDRFGARVPVVIEGDVVTSARARRAPDGSFVNRLDHALVERVVGERVEHDRIPIEAESPIVLRFGASLTRSGEASAGRAEP